MLRFRKDFLLENLSLGYIICMGLLRSYIGYHNIWRILLMVVFLMLFLSKKIYRKIVYSFYVKSSFFWIVIFTGVCSILMGLNNKYLFKNVARWMEVQLILCLVVMLTSNQKFNIRAAMMRYFYIFNLFWVANLVVLAIQCTGTGFMIKDEWLAANRLYADHCSGLFGASGTHKLSFYAIFVMVYNLYVTRETRNKYQKSVIYIFTLATQLWMLYLSPKNDNKTLFILLPAFLVAYYVVSNIDRIHELNKKMLLRAGKIAGSLLVVIIIAIIVLSNVEETKEYFNRIVLQSAFTLATQGRRGSIGSIERLTIATDALSRARGWLFGDGLGTTALSEAVSGHYRGYRHFSMSSIGTLITLGGIWFYISYCMIYTKAFSQFINYKNRSILCQVICFTLLVALTVYTPLFEAEISMLWLCFTFVMCGKEQKEFLM